MAKPASPSSNLPGLPGDYFCLHCGSLLWRQGEASASCRCGDAKASGQFQVTRPTWAILSNFSKDRRTFNKGFNIPELLALHRAMERDREALEAAN